MGLDIAQRWLEDLQQSANDKDYQAHMDLISRQVSVFGFPGFEVIGYDDWARQCKHEFENNILKQVSYGPMKIAAIQKIEPRQSLARSARVGTGFA